MEHYDEFYDFMCGYVDFFTEVEKKEEQKLKALYSRDYGQLEGILKEHQVTEKKVMEYERKREELHQRLGLDGKSFREIIDAHREGGGSGTEKLEALYNRLKTSVNNTKHYNEKALEFSKMNLDIIDEIKALNIPDSPVYDAKGTKNQSGKDKPSFFSTKI